MLFVCELPVHDSRFCSSLVNVHTFFVEAKTLEDAKLQALEFLKGKKVEISKVEVEAKTEAKTEVEAEVEVEAEPEFGTAEYDRRTIQSSYENFVYWHLSKEVRARDDVYTLFVDFVSKNLDVYPAFVGRVYTSTYGYYE
jgi:hypothetical protein